MRKLAWYGAAAAGAAMLYLAWVGATRVLENRRMERAAEAKQARAYGSLKDDTGTAVRILQFYANTGELTEGEHAVICYGVENARAVHLEPAVERLKPALNRCFAVEPVETTTYTLVADGFDGAQTSESFTVRVRPAPPFIFFFATSEKEIRRGEPFTVCYGVEHAASARLEPVGMGLPPVRKNCVRMYPAQTMKFTLVAASADGRTDRAKFTVNVK
jgi:hypothetical protein